MRKIVLGGVIAVMMVLGLGSAVQATGDDKDQTPKAHLKVDICHNGHIIPVSVNSVAEVDTGHGLFNPKTLTLTARVDTPGHKGDTLLRVYVKAGKEEITIHSNKDAKCTLEQPKLKKISIEVCVNGELKLFESFGDLESLKAEVEAYVKAHALGEFIKVGNSCVPVTTTTVPGSTVPSTVVTTTTVPPAPVIAVPPAPVKELPRTGSGIVVLALIGGILGGLGLAGLLTAEIVRRVTKG